MAKHRDHRRKLYHGKRPRGGRVNGLLLVCGLAYLALAALTAGVFGVPIVSVALARTWAALTLTAAGVLSIVYSVRWRW